MNNHDLQGSQPRQWANLFELTNLQDLSVSYRLLKVQGLPQDDLVDKSLNRLAKNVAYELRQPATLVRQHNAPHIAIPTDAPLPTLQQRLMPHVAVLVPSEESVLPLNCLDADTEPIATAFLQYALRGPLMRDQDLWGNGRSWFAKTPLAASGHSVIDLYPGFVWNVVAGDDGRLFVSIDVTVRAVDRLWLRDRVNGDLNGYRGRSCLYHYGHQWYVVQLQALTDSSIADQKFIPGDGAPIVSVLAYTRKRWELDAPLWIRDLDPTSPAIKYRNPGSEQERYGALALCKRIYTTADAEAQGVHRQAILDPTTRFERASAVASRHFQHANMMGQPLRIAMEPLEIPRRVFPVPLQRFGHDRVLAVDQPGASATDHVSIDYMGKSRLRLLQDPQAGPLDTSPFDAQTLLLPAGLPRTINDDFSTRFAAAMRALSGQPHYNPKVVLYPDRDARTLRQQVTAIREAMDHNRVGRGYALLVLPEHAKPDLHNYIKKSLWPNVQFQCATARKIRSFYQAGPNGVWFPQPQREQTLTSYVRNCALGMMVVNRKWAWALETPLHYDVYVGIDVLHGMAGLTFVYDRGRHIYFREYKCMNPERLTAAQLTDILTTRLGEDIPHHGVSPRSLIVHRDGRMFPSEITGLKKAVESLTRQGVLPPGIIVGVVDIRKASIDHLRIAEGYDRQRLQNPIVGSHLAFATNGIVSTTGRPFAFPGTAKPLAAAIVYGDLDIEWVLEDIFALSQPIFTAPDKCARLPMTIRLADDFLEPIAGAADEEAALYESDLADAESEEDQVDNQDHSRPLSIARIGRA